MRITIINLDKNEKRFASFIATTTKQVVLFCKVHYLSIKKNRFESTKQLVL